MAMFKHMVYLIVLIRELAITNVVVENETKLCAPEKTMVYLVPTHQSPAPT